MNTTINSMLAEITALLAKSHKALEAVTAPTSKPVAPKTETAKVAATAPVTAPFAEGTYVSCSYSDLLNEIRYDPEGKLPKEHNVFVDKGDTSKEVYWFCSDKPVCITTPTGKLVKIADNAFARIKTSIAKKWSFERDWIPEYKYSLENNEAVVGYTLMKCLVDMVDRSEIVGRCFKALDAENTHFDPASRKTVLEEENCNSADRFVLSMMLTGSVESLTRLTAFDDGHELALPTAKDVAEQYDADEVEQLKYIGKLIADCKARHKSADPKAWQSALYSILRVPTYDAIKLLFGDKLGKKQKHSAKVKYSRWATEVVEWLLDEVKESEDKEHLTKWVAVLENVQLYNECYQKYLCCVKYSIMSAEALEYIKVAMQYAPEKYSAVLENALAEFASRCLNEANEEKPADFVETKVADIPETDTKCDVAIEGEFKDADAFFDF